MSISSRLLGFMGKLPPVETRRVAVERDVPVPMADGVTLLGDHYAPQGLGPRPTVLVRSPYGRAGLTGMLFGRPVAERGFHVFIQSCRGTFGSGGTFDAFRGEREDGLATIAWLKEQPWFDGRLAMMGASYLGLVQWAVAAEVDDVLQAMSTWMTSAEMRTLNYHGESFFLETMLTWVNVVHTQERARFGMIGQMIEQKLGKNARLEAGFRQLPLTEADRLVTGKRVDYYQAWLAHNGPGDAYWTSADFSGRVPEVSVPNHMIGGWYDIFLPQTMRDYAALRAAGREPYLTIGPWAHVDPPVQPFALREGIIWLRAHLLDDRAGLRSAPVRVYVMGANEWRDLAEWPPAGMTTQRWYLQPAGKLSPTPPPASEPDRYVYDPTDPTPNVGGAGMGRITGPRDNRKLEVRPDVLTYTTEPFSEDFEIVGPVGAELFVRSDREHTDFFVRLCDVDGRGKSTNICDGLLRLVPGRPAAEADGCLCVRLELWPTAYRFRRGHALRVQVSSGAFPRWARNTGSGEPLGTARMLCAAVQQVYHDPGHPSAVLLPVA